MESYFGRLQVSYAADTFNSYCQSMLGEWLDLHSERWEMISGSFPKEDPVGLRKKTAAAASFRPSRSGSAA
jgi:hypothetical protein